MLLLMYPFWFARSLIGIESPTARQPCVYYFGIGIDFTSIYIFDCAPWLRHAMPRGHLTASLLGHSVCMSTLLVRHCYHRSGHTIILL
jgi:hypothetical protein